MKIFVFAIFFAITSLGWTLEAGIGFWRLGDGRILAVNSDQTAELMVGQKIEWKGRWEADPFSDSIKKYSLKWQNGQAFDAEVSPDGAAIRAKRTIDVPGAVPISGVRVEKIDFALWINDVGTLCVNGEKVATASLKSQATGSFFAKTDDAISIDANNKTGVLEIAFECRKSGSAFLSAREMYYTTKPSDEWRKGKIEFGYRMPVAVPNKTVKLGKFSDAPVVVSQKEDQSAKSLFFKFVVK